MANETDRPSVPLDHPNEREHRQQLARRANAALPHDGTAPMTAPLRLFPVTVADLATSNYAPDLWTGAVVYVSDEAGGAVPAWSNGTNWKRFTDGNTVS